MVLPDLVRSVIIAGSPSSAISFLEQSNGLVAVGIHQVVKVFDGKNVCDVIRFPSEVLSVWFRADLIKDSGPGLSVITKDGCIWMFSIQMNVLRCESKPTVLRCVSSGQSVVCDLDVHMDEQAPRKTHAVARKITSQSAFVSSALTGFLVHTSMPGYHLSLSSFGFARLLHCTSTGWVTKMWSEPPANCCLLLSSTTCKLPFIMNIFAINSEKTMIAVAGNNDGRVMWSSPPPYEDDDRVEHGIVADLHEPVVALLFCREGNKQALVMVSREGSLAIIQSQQHQQQQQQQQDTPQYFRLLCPELAGKLIIDAAVSVEGVVLLLSQRALLKFEVWQQPAGGMFRAELIPIALSILSISISPFIDKPTCFVLSTLCGKVLVCNTANLLIIAAKATTVTTAATAPSEHPCLHTPSVLREAVLAQSCILDEMIQNIKNLYEKEQRLMQGSEHINHLISVMNTALYLKDTVFQLRVAALIDKSGGQSRLVFRIVILNCSDESFLFPSNSSILIHIRLQNPSSQSYKVFSFSMPPPCTTLLCAGAAAATHASDAASRTMLELQVSCPWEAPGGMGGFFIRGKVDLMYDFPFIEDIPPTVLQSSGVTAVFTPASSPAQSVRSTIQSLGHFYLDILDLMYVDAKPGAGPRAPQHQSNQDLGGWMWLREIAAHASNSSVEPARSQNLLLELPMLPSLTAPGIDPSQSLLAHLVQALPRNADIPLARNHQALCSPPIGFKYVIPSPLQPRFQLRVQEVSSSELTNKSSFSTRVLVLAASLPFPELFPAVRWALLRRLPPPTNQRDDLWQAVCAHLRAGGWKQLDYAVDQLILRLQGIAGKSKAEQVEIIFSVLREAKRLYLSSRELSKTSQTSAAHVL